MGGRRRVAGLMVALVTGACAPGALAAAKPIVIGKGDAPSVAVDSAGTAHVAYNDTASVDQAVRYCRLARGASGCTAPQTFVLPGSTTVRPYVFADGGTVRILSWRYGLSLGPFAQDFLLTSTDGGQTFGAPVSVGTLMPNDAVAGPGAAISLVSAAGPESPSYQRVPTDGSAPVTAAARLSTTKPYETAVGLLGAITPVAAFDDGAATPMVGYSVARDLANLNTTASWSESSLDKGSVPHLAGGPVGLFLMLSTIDRASGQYQLEVFRFGDDGAFPRSGTYASYRQPGPFAASALVQDDAGVLQSVYAAGEGNTHLMANAASGEDAFGTPKEIAADDTFYGLRIASAADHAGVAVWTDGVGADAEIHAAPFAASINTEPTPVYDLRANGLEVTQSVQTREAGFLGGELPSLYRAPLEGELPTRSFGNVRYRGAGLAAYSKTVVRMFADATPVGSSGAPRVKDVVGVLRGFRNGKELPGSPLLAENGPRTLTDGGCPCVTADQRADPAASYDFTLPLSWTISANPKLMLRGELRQQAGILTTFANARPVRAGKLARTAAALRPRECATCAGNNRFTLTDIPFTPTPIVVIAPVRMFVQGDPPLPDPAEVLAPALNLHPGGERFLVEPYQANLDVTTESGWKETDPECKAYVERDKFGDCKNDAYSDRVRAWDRAQGGLSDMAIGVNTRERGLAGRSLFNLPPGNPDKTAKPDEVNARPVAVVSTQRPLSSVAHELGHLLGSGHASAACGGGGDLWPPDQVGYIGGIGLDRSQRTADAGAPYRVIAGIPPTLGNCGNNTPPGCGGTKPEQYFDVMSYCGYEDNAWISVRNWDAELGTLNRFGQRVGFNQRSFPSTPVPYVTATIGRRAVPAASGMLHVEATVDTSGAHIDEVGRTVHALPAPAASDYAAEVRDASGAVLSSTPMAANAAHVEGGGGAVQLSADVPSSARAASIAVAQGGATIATRPRSAHPPTVRVTAPASGARVGTSAVVRWTAKDADGDPLAATVAYSLDDGNGWRTIYAGPSTGSAQLPGAYFSASRRARVLVRVNDGFDERGAISGRFRARGVPPVVRLRSPGPGTKLLSSSTLVLQGEAFDDASQPLTGKRLVWFAGKRRLGTGAALSTADLSPGRQRLRLVASDRMGRRGTAAVTVAVTAVKPQLLELNGPKKVSRRARKVTLRLAVNTRSRLTSNGRAFTVGRRVTRVTLPIRPGRGALKLKLLLRAGGKRTKVALTLPRR